MESKNDEHLVNQYLKGDEKSLEFLIQRYLKPIYNFVYRYVGNIQNAEDITQEVFVKVWRNIKKFDQQKKFKTWIFTIAKNTSIDFLKKKKVIPFSEFEGEKSKNTLIETLSDNGPLPDEIFDWQDIIEKLNLAMQNLPSQYRIVLSLRYNDHFAFREIAEILGEPLNTIKSRYRRALMMLRKLLKNS